MKSRKPFRVIGDHDTPRTESAFSTTLSSVSLAFPGPLERTRWDGTSPRGGGLSTFSSSRWFELFLPLASVLSGLTSVSLASMGLVGITSLGSMDLVGITSLGLAGITSSDLADNLGGLGGDTPGLDVNGLGVHGVNGLGVLNLLGVWGVLGVNGLDPPRVLIPVDQVVHKVDHVFQGIIGPESPFGQFMGLHRPNDEVRQVLRIVSKGQQKLKVAFVVEFLGEPIPDRFPGGRTVLDQQVNQTLQSPWKNVSILPIVADVVLGLQGFDVGPILLLHIVIKVRHPNWHVKACGAWQRSF